MSHTEQASLSRIETPLGNGADASNDDETIAILNTPNKNQIFKISLGKEEFENALPKSLY